MRENPMPRVPVAATAVFLAAAGAVSAAGTVTRSFPFQAGETLRVDTELGHIQVRNGDRDEVEVTVSARGADVEDVLELSFDGEGKGLRVEARAKKRAGTGIVGRWLGRSSPEVELEITAPRRVDLELTTDGGHIEVERVQGDVRVTTAGGHISLDDVDGKVVADTSGGHIEAGTIARGGELRTSGGHIQVDAAGADLEVRTSGGHIEVGEVIGGLIAETAGGHISVERVDGPVELSTSGGHISLDGARGPARVSTSGGRIALDDMAARVEARSGGGDITVTLAPGNRDGVDIETGQGDIDLEVPGGIGYQVDARTRHGRVRSALSIDGDVGSARLRGIVAGGGSQLRLRTGHGDIRIDATP